MEALAQYERLLERFGNGDLDRRTFLGRIGRMALGAGLVGSAMGPLARLAAAAQSIRYDAYGGVSQGAFSKFVLQPFAAKTGTTVNQGSYGVPQELIAKIQADGIQNYNLCNCSDQSTVLRMIRLGYGVELDESKIPRLENVIPRALEMYRRLGGGKLPAIPFGLSGGWIGFDPKKVERTEVESKGFKILVDPKYKGAITGQDLWIQRIWYAAIQSDQNPNDIKNVDAVWDKIRESKTLVVKYWRSSAEQMMLFTSGSAVVGDAWFVPSYNLMKRGVSFTTHPQKGAYVDFGSLMVLKSAPLDLVYQIADILLRPEVMIAIAEEVGNVPLLDPNKHPVPEGVKKLPGFDPTGTLDGYQAFDPFYWTAHADAWQKEYLRVMARG